jgi:hypothetical protein
MWAAVSKPSLPGIRMSRRIEIAARLPGPVVQIDPLGQIAARHRVQLARGVRRGATRGRRSDARI